MKNCVCRIKCHEDGHGTGYFCNIQYDDWNSIRVLMTNNHIINEKDLFPGNSIYFFMNNENNPKQLLIDDKRITYTSIEYDTTIIEIRENDRLKADTFLEIDKKVFEGVPHEIFKEKSIYLLHFPEGIKIQKSEGTILGISLDNYVINHNCNSNYGSSGGPLIGFDSFKLIGIHKGAESNKNWNLGTFIRGPIEEFIKKMNKNKINNEKKDEKIDEKIDEKKDEKNENMMKNSVNTINSMNDNSNNQSIIDRTVTDTSNETK
jgi:hypothetical protein